MHKIKPLNVLAQRGEAPEPAPLAKLVFFKMEWKREWVFFKGISMLQWMDRPTQMRIYVTPVGLHGCCLNDMKFKVAREVMYLGGVTGRDGG